MSETGDSVLGSPAVALGVPSYGKERSQTDTVPHSRDWGPALRRASGDGGLLFPVVGIACWGGGAVSL